MISAREAMERAIAVAEAATPRDAETWVAIAAELRAGERKRSEAEPAGSRLTLHDVEGKVCPAARVVIRLRGSSGDAWWMHTDDRNMCTCQSPDAYSATEPPTTRMDLRGEATTQLHVPLRRQPDSGQPQATSAICVHCGYDVYFDDTGSAPVWRHDMNEQRTCPTPQHNASGDETFVHTMAWPAVAE